MRLFGLLYALGNLPGVSCCDPLTLARLVQGERGVSVPFARELGFVEASGLRLEFMLAGSRRARRED